MNYKPKKEKDGWHVTNKKGWVALICEKKSTAKVVGIILDNLEFDDIKNGKRAKVIYDLVKDIALILDTCLK